VLGSILSGLISDRVERLFVFAIPELEFASLLHPIYTAVVHYNQRSL
jgi:hypothetical protein